MASSRLGGLLIFDDSLSYPFWSIYIAVLVIYVNRGINYDACYFEKAFLLYCSHLTHKLHLSLLCFIFWKATPTQPRLQSG